MTPLGYTEHAATADEAMNRLRDAGVNAGMTREYHRRLFMEMGHEDINNVEARLADLDSYPYK